MNNYKIAVLGGDGIGPEVIEQAVRVLNKVSEKYNFIVNYEYYLVGGSSIDVTGVPLTDEAFNSIKQADAVLLGAVGGAKWDNIDKSLRPEQALFKLRGGLNLFANLRPILLFEELMEACPLKSEIVGDGLDIMIVRELTGGIYFGKKWTDGDVANDIMTYSVNEVERIVDVAIKSARRRAGKITSVDKANVLDSSRLWRKVFEDMTANLNELKCNNMLVDNAAMQLIRNPKQFDVIVTGNLFGDILSDEAAMLTGSIGMLPSASIGNSTFGMYEPVHGSAPDIAGKSIANPLAAILCVAMMLRYSFNMEEAACAVELAVKKALKSGARTADLVKAGEDPLSTVQMADMVLKYI